MNKTFFKGGALVLAAVVSTGQAFAGASQCAGADDVYALRAAALQQRLMVAGLNCRVPDRYNKFVQAYRKDLQAADVRLQQFFRRLNGRTGEADYHTFKTRLANTSANQSDDDRKGYCANAEATFADALNGKSKPLRVFVSDKAADAERDYAPCPVSALKPK